MTSEQLKGMNNQSWFGFYAVDMLAARAYGCDTNPIDGYEKDKITEVFAMDKERYYPAMLISMGKAKDKGYQSVRLPIESITEWKQSELTLATYRKEDYIR